ncbi:MAG TPA: DinB family protein [Ktedonobacterales bacterium]
MTTPAIEQYLFLLDAGFDGPDWHSLMRNLSTVTPADWTWVPPGGERSIRDIVRHVGRVKLMAHDQAFGGGTLTWDDPRLDGDQATGDIPSAIAWLRLGHQRLRAGIAALTDDAELARPRRTNWGELRETRWVIAVTMIQHDVYHAGEINHLRSLHQQADQWE